MTQNDEELLPFDHMLLAKQDPVETARFLQAAFASRVFQPAILHEDDMSCCAVEPWEKTCRRLAQEWADGTGQIIDIRDNWPNVEE